MDPAFGAEGLGWRVCSAPLFPRLLALGRALYSGLALRGWGPGLREIYLKGCFSIKGSWLPLRVRDTFVRVPLRVIWVSIIGFPLS